MSAPLLKVVFDGDHPYGMVTLDGVPLQRVAQISIKILPDEPAVVTLVMDTPFDVDVPATVHLVAQVGR